MKTDKSFGVTVVVTVIVTVAVPVTVTVGVTVGIIKLKKNLDHTSPFCGATDTPVLDF